MERKQSFRVTLGVASVFSAVLMISTGSFGQLITMLESFSCSFLTGSTVLLMYPLGMTIRPSSLTCAFAGQIIMLLTAFVDAPTYVIMGESALFILCSNIHFLRHRYSDLNSLVRRSTAWHGLERDSQSFYSAVHYMMCGALCVAIEKKCIWALALISILSLTVFLLLIIRNRTSHTMIVNGRRDGIIKKMSEESHQLLPPARTDEKSRMKSVYDDVCLLMEESRPFLKEVYTIRDMSRALGTNRAYLSRVINIYSGQHYPQFLNSYRIEHAKKLIRGNPDLKFSDVAAMSGFNTIVSFNMAFKLHTGQTPTDFVKGLSRIAEKER